ncbi:hypothetical protein JCM15519_07830 [Fundidesulfovibrio butyratiphilus]
MRLSLPYLLLCLLPLAACTHKPADELIQTAVPAVIVPASRADIADGRGRFREIYQAVQKDHGAALPFDRSPDKALWRLAEEPQSPGRPVNLADGAGNFRVALVPGFLAECAAEWSKVFEDARANLEKRGFATESIRTGGRLSCEKNAEIIRNAVMAMPEGQRVILVGHSKGAPDCLTALALYPELETRVVALIGVAGAVAGSPLADVLPQALLDFASHAKLHGCPKTEAPCEALQSLRRSERLRWAAAHPAPKGVRLYSLAAVATPVNTSLALKPFAGVLSETDPLNDGMVMAADSLMPGSTLLGYANADHLAVAMPFGKSTPVLTATLINKNDFPRAVLLEAMVRFVVEDLTKTNVQ